MSKKKGYEGQSSHFLKIWYNSKKGSNFFIIMLVGCIFYKGSLFIRSFFFFFCCLPLMVFLEFSMLDSPLGKIQRRHSR